MQTANNGRRMFPVIGISCLVAILAAPIGCAPKLTVTETVVPTGDPGRFNIQIDGSTKATNLGNGGSTGRMSLSAGTYKVSQTGAGGTNLADYTSIIGGDCAPDGSITLADGDVKTCTITNTSTREHCLTECARALGYCMERAGTHGGPGTPTPPQQACVTTYNECVSRCPAP